MGIINVCTYMYIPSDVFRRVSCYFFRKLFYEDAPILSQFASTAVHIEDVANLLEQFVIVVDPV